MVKRYLWVVLSAAFMFFLVVVLFNHALYVDLGFDPAYHATVAKNIANGVGYATSYDSLFYLNPDITTGPVMILFAALFVFIFGNAIWVPAVAALALNLTIILFIIYLVVNRKELSRSVHFFLWSFISILVLYSFPWLFVLKGDFTSTLLLLLCLLILYSANYSLVSRFSWSVLVFIFAVATKKIAMIAVVGFIPFILMNAVEMAKVRWRVLIVWLFSAIGCFLAWYVLSNLLTMNLSAGQITEKSNYAFSFFYGQGSGLSQLYFSESLPYKLIENAFRNAALLQNFYIERFDWGWLQSVVLVFVFISIFKSMLSGSMSGLLVAIFLVVLTFFIWFIFFSAAWSAKYAVNYSFIFIFGVVLFFCERNLRVVTFTFLLVLLVLPDNSYKKMAYQAVIFSSQDSAYRNDLNEVASLIERGELDKYPMSGCGWVFAPHELEYVLLEHLNFSDCRKEILKGLKFNDDAYYDLYPEIKGKVSRGEFISAQDHYRKKGRLEGRKFIYTWEKPVNFYLLINNLYWNTSAYSYRFNHIVSACFKIPIYEGEHLSVAMCSSENLKAGMYVDEREFFLKNDEGFFYVHKPEQLDWK